MGVPEGQGSMGPAKKRQRLSLKTIKKKTDFDGEQKPNLPIMENNSGRKPNDVVESRSYDSCTTLYTSSSDTASSCITETSSSSNTELRVPAVASLENFGNTCFMNSIMQVLRYTPGFLENLAITYQNVQMVEKIKKKMKSTEDTKEKESEPEDQKNCWNVVKAVYKVYRDQSLLEEKYEEIASDDVMSMAVKPIKVLQAVRVLNPMYEGSMQHDAQEFLRCFLAYLQDAEKSTKNFPVQIQNTVALKAAVNPVMQKFLQSAKNKEIKSEVSNTEDIKKGGNQLYDDRADKNFEEGVAVSVNSAKVNLFAKLQSVDKAEVFDDKSCCVSEAQKVPAESSPQTLDKLLPKIGSTAENILEKASDNLAGLQSANMVAATESSELLVDNGIQTSNVNKKQAKNVKKSREQPPHDCLTKDKNDKNAIRKEVQVSSWGESKTSNKKLTQPSITDIYYKTYSKKKRLGMSRSVKKHNSVENMFDKVQELDEAHKDGNSMETGVESECNNENQQLTSMASLPDMKDTTASICETTETVRESKSDSCIMNMDNSKMLEYSHLINAVYSTAGNAGESISDSDENEEDIIQVKKIAKHLHNSPRRSPRKSNSQMLIPSPALINKSVFSQSESDIHSVKLNLNSNFDSVDNCQESDSSKFSETDCTMDTRTQSLTVDNESPDRITVDCDITFKKQKTGHPTDYKMALEPVIQLENCDHVFKNNETSVSAIFATKCLSPSKRTPKKECYSSNYLRQRNLLDSMEYENTEALEEALEAMFNSPGKSKSKCDFTERLFQGSMMLRTRCLLCETSTERQEDFHDISVPVRIDKEESDDEDSNKDNSMEESRYGLLDLIEASTEVEKLQNDNKFFCGHCIGYMEAERSIHYDALPDILTLHLKRFSASSGSFSYISKINDAVNIPLSLPCLRYKCPQSCLRPDHKYKLYGIITHTGVTLSSGHYLAYVRARPHKQNTIFTKQTVIDEPNNQAGTVPQNPPIKTQNTSDYQPSTRGKLGIVSKLPSRFDGSVISNTKVKTFATISGKGKKEDKSESLKTNRKFDTQWFECDDETIRVFEESEFLDLLTEKHGSLLGTPYLLFYHKSTIC